MSRKIFIIILLLFTVVSLLLDWDKKGSSGQFPERPINVIVHSSPGGGADIWARKIAALMEKELGVTMIVTNKPGGKGGVAANAVWNAPHDGYTLLGGSETSMIYFVNGASEKTSKDWDFMIGGGSPGVIATLAGSKINSREKFVNYISENDPISISNSGKGKLWHLKAVLIEKYSKIPIIHSSYNGSNPAIVALLNGEVDAISCSAGEVAGYVESGKVLPILMTENEPYHFKGFGKVPPVTDFFPEINKYMPMKQVLCLLMPNDLPRGTKNVLKEAFHKSMNSSEMTTFIKNQYAKKIGVTGSDAKKIAFELESKLSWLIYELDLSSVSPEEGEITKLD